MSALTYMAGFGFDKDGLVVAQATTLVDPSRNDVDERWKLRSIMNGIDGVEQYQVSVFTSSSFGEEKHPDGKDRYRIHKVVDNTTSTPSQMKY